HDEPGDSSSTGVGETTHRGSVRSPKRAWGEIRNGAGSAWWKGRPAVRLPARTEEHTCRSTELRWPVCSRTSKRSIRLHRCRHVRRPGGFVLVAPHQSSAERNQ